MGNGAVRCVHAVGVHHVAVVVPEPSKEVLSAVFIPNVVVSVKCCELHVVQICKTVTWGCDKQMLVDSEKAHFCVQSWPLLIIINIQRLIGIGTV